MEDAAHQYENLDFGDSACSTPMFNDNAWRKITLPAYWESTEIRDFQWDSYGSEKKRAATKMAGTAA